MDTAISTTPTRANTMKILFVILLLASSIASADFRTVNAQIFPGTTTGIVTPNTPAIGDNSTNAATTAFLTYGSQVAGVAPTIPASTIGYAIPVASTLYIGGGTITAITITRATVAWNVGMLSGVFPVSQGDIVTMTYTVAPTTFFYLPR